MSFIKTLSRFTPAILLSIATYIGLIIADPATSPFYAIESALEHVGNNYIVLTMVVVLIVAVSVSIGYAAIGIRFNKGEGGTGLVYEWLGPKAAMLAAASLIIDFILTDAVTMAAAVAAIVSYGVDFNRYVLLAIVFVVITILLKLGDKGRLVFAFMSFLFMGLVLYVVALPVLPNASEILASYNTTEAVSHIPVIEGLSGLALITLVLFGAVRGFALLTGFEASVAALASEEEKPKAVRIAMGIGTILAVLIFTSIVTFNIASVTQSMNLQPNHEHTLISLWTDIKLEKGLIRDLLTLSGIGILLSGCASGATAGGGMLHVLIKSKILPKELTHVDNEHNDFRAMMIIHAIAAVIVIFFGVKEQAIVAFYAISVLIGFCLSLIAALKFGFKTKTWYLFLALPGVLMVILALAVNLGRFEGYVIIAVALVLALILYRRWVKGGKHEINFTH